jgi:hypothetical protein
MHHASIPSILTTAESAAGIRKPSKRCVVAALSDAIYLRGPNRHAPQHRAPLVHTCARRIRLSKTFQNLNPDFLREWTLDLAHAIPEPDDFALLLDVHWSPPKMINENITRTILQAANGENAEAATRGFRLYKQRLRIFNRQDSAARDFGFATFACFDSFGELFGEAFGLGRS